MAGELSLAGAILMPNGVDTDAFRPLDRSLSLSMTGFDGSLFNIIFVGDPSRHEKNYSLAGEAVQILSDRAVNLITLKDIPAGMMPWYYNAANLLLLTSLWEGSPNCVKEAMACNLPVVATAVGDVPQLISGLEGCFISTFDSHHVAECIEKAMTFSDRTRGRERIMERGLDAPSTAARLVRLYEVISGEVHGG
jgi:glycosyltransferase involved in cell wall biosynthesis